MSSNLKIKLHEATQNNDGEDSYRFAKITYTFKNPYGVKETFSDIVHFRDRIPVDSIKDEAIESFYESMRVNGFIPVGEEDEHVVILQAAYGKLCVAEYSDKDRPFKIDYAKYAKPGALRKFVTVVDVIWSNDMYDEFCQGNQYLIDQMRKRDKERDERGEYSEAVSKVLSDADRKFLQGHTINNAQLNAFEREFPKLKFKDTFFPKNPTYRATPDEIPLTAEDAETMIGSREDFLLMCLDALRSTRSVERVKSAEGEDVITAYT